MKEILEGLVRSATTAFWLAAALLVTFTVLYVTGSRIALVLGLVEFLVLQGLVLHFRWSMRTLVDIVRTPIEAPVTDQEVALARMLRAWLARLSGPDAQLNGLDGRTMKYCANEVRHRLDIDHRKALQGLVEGWIS